MTRDKSNRDEFLARLGRFSGAWKRGLAFALILRVAAWAAVAVAVYYAADYFFALDEAVRGWLNILIPAGLAAAAAPEAVRIIRLGPSEAAALVDRLAGHRRKDVLTAWDLQSAAGQQPAADGAEATLSGFLVRRSIGDAVARLAALRPGILHPRELTARRWRSLGAALLVALGAIALLGPDALLTIVPRLVWPGRDIPPYSRYRFEVRPDAPSVLYGGSAEVSAAIRGAPVNDRVWIMTRRSGQRPLRAACFQEGGERYAQRIETITAPVEFCFAVGRARSRWHRVDVQLQPQIVLSRIRITPPSYTRLPVREFPAGQEDVAGIRGTRVTLTLASNRPLKDGTLTVSHRRSAAGDKIVEGRRLTDRSIAFEWTVEADAEAKATLRDVRGTPTTEPLVVRQRLVPDEPPRVTLSDPPEFCMATPSAALKVAGSVEDDFGIEQVDCIRTVVGFNDRGLSLKRGSAGTRFEFDSELNLGALGVDPGETLEFYAEALDNNPYLPGAGASVVARVKVIGEEEYAEWIRNREALEQFMARYDAALQAMNLVRDSLGELHGQVLWRNPDPEKLAKTVKKALDAHTAAESLFRQLAKDFAAYDSEKTLKKTARDIVAKLGENKVELAAIREPGTDTADKVEAMLKRLGEEAESLQRQGVSAALVAALAKVMDGAARFQAVVRRQEALVRWLKQRYGTRVDSTDLPFLPGYGEHQGDIAAALTEFATNVTAAAAALPDDLKALKKDVAAFVRALERSGASNHMAQAVAACRNTDAARACREAQLALEKLQSLLKPGCLKGDGEGEGEGSGSGSGAGSGAGNSFAGMCRGESPDFGPDDMKQTLREMFRALCRKRGAGSGEGDGGGGSGGDGTGSDGFGGDGVGSGSGSYSALSTPVYGPERSALGRQGRDGTGGAGEGSGRGTGGAEQGHAVVERMRNGGLAAPSGEAMPLERLPAKYRDAVKRYFQNGKEGGVP